MDNKGIRLVEKAIGSESSKHWNKAVDYIDDWSEIRKYLNNHDFGLKRLRIEANEHFEEACTRYNHAVNNPKLSTGQKAGLLTGAAIAGLVLGLKSK